MTSTELIAEKEADRWILRSPEAGLFTRALARGCALAPGQEAGSLIRLGRAHTLVVPAGVQGVISSTPPERIHAPVGAGEALYEVSPVGEVELGADEDSGDGALSASGNPIVVSPQAGRFYVSPSPSDPPFVSAGSVLHEGVAVGMIEVMKTFTQILYRPGGHLPARASVVRVLAKDGADVSAGDPLFEVVAEEGTAS